MRKLKKLAVLPVLAVFLLSCLPETVQAVTVIQKDEHTVPEKHGDTIFENEDTQHVTCNSNRIEFQTDNCYPNIYLENPVDYIVVQYPGIDARYVIFITPDDDSFQPYEVRDGQYAQSDNCSVTTFTYEPVYYNGEKYVFHQTFYGDEDAEPVYRPTVISLPPDCTREQLLEYLITGDFSDCRVSEGDADNPAQNASGGIPGSESNPEYDKDIGRVVFNGNTFVYPDTYANFIGKNKEYVFNFKWEKETDTGYNLVKSSHAVCKLQFKIEPELYMTYDGSKDGVEAPLETKDLNLGNFNASDLSHKFNFYDLINKFYPTQLKLAESGGSIPGHTPNSQTLKLMTFRFAYYVRPIVSDSLTVIPNQTSGWKCGDWTLVTVSGTLNDVTTETQPGHFDENGEWQSDGESVNIDDGRIPTDGDVDKTIEEYENGDDGKHSVKDVVALLNSVSKFPLAFAKMFSFLPDWCLDLIALSFSCMMVILLIKAVRG